MALPDSSSRSPRAHTLGSRLLATVATALIVTGIATALPSGAAAQTDISLDFTAAAPLSYDHATGGGAYDNRSVGRDRDVVESLAGTDFACDDVVTFLTRIDTGASVVSGSVMELSFEHLADATGQSGIGFSEVLDARLNTGNVGGEGPGGTDLAITGPGTPSAALIDQHLTAPLFTPRAVLASTVRITGLEPSSSTVLRLDVRVACHGTARPTGNLQAAVAGARLTAPSVTPVRVGNQTIPFRMIANVTPRVYIAEPVPSTTLPVEPSTTTTVASPCTLELDEHTVVPGVSPTLRLQGGPASAPVSIELYRAEVLTTTTNITLDGEGAATVALDAPIDGDLGVVFSATALSPSCTTSWTVQPETAVEPTTTTTAPETTVDETIPDTPGPTEITIDVEIENTGEDPDQTPTVTDLDLDASCTQDGRAVFTGPVTVAGLAAGNPTDDLPIGASLVGRFTASVDPAGAELACELDATGIVDGDPERIPVNESRLTVDVEELTVTSTTAATLPATGPRRHTGETSLLGLALVGLGVGCLALSRRTRPAS